MPQTLPTAADQTVEYEDYYESSLAQPLGTSDTDIFPETIPVSAVGFLVLDATGTQPETIFYNFKGANFVRCPSASDGQGRGVFGTTPNAYQAGTKVGMYSIAAFFEGIVTGKFMRDGFIQARHFNTSIDPNNWVGVGQTLVFGANQGQNVSTYVASGDITSTLKRGTSLQLPRVAVTNTRCADLEADSSQYAKMSSPNGVTFTGPFTVEAWVTPESYASTGGVIFCRDQGSVAGWSFELEAVTNCLVVFWRNASTFSLAKTYYSVPITERSHVAVSVSSIGTPAADFYINGVLVPSRFTQSSATTMVQGGDLSIGFRTGSQLDAKVSEVRGWTIARTQQQILDNMNKRLTGSETNLFAYFRLDGDFNDLSPNGNNLTAQGGATATTVDNPFSVIEHGKIIDATFSSGNTTISVYTGNKRVAPAEDIVNAAYSYNRTPPGMPNAQGDWRIRNIIHTSVSGNFSLAGTWEQPLPFNLVVPIGDWRLGYQGNLGQDNSSGAGYDLRLSYFNGANFVEDSAARMSGTQSVTSISQHWYKQFDASLTAQSTSLLFKQLTGGGGGTVSAVVRGDLTPTTLFAECPYI